MYIYALFLLIISWRKLRPFQTPFLAGLDSVFPYSYWKVTLSSPSCLFLTLFLDVFPIIFRCNSFLGITTCFLDIFGRLDSFYFGSCIEGLDSTFSSSYSEVIGSIPKSRLLIPNSTLYYIF